MAELPFFPSSLLALYLVWKIWFFFTPSYKMSEFGKKIILCIYVFTPLAFATIGTPPLISQGCENLACQKSLSFQIWKQMYYPIPLHVNSGGRLAVGSIFQLTQCRLQWSLQDPCVEFSIIVCLRKVTFRGQSTISTK